MYTYCPHCSAVFSVNVAHLGKAGGLARCGECRQIYSVIDYLYEDVTTARMALAEAEAATRAAAGVSAGIAATGTPEPVGEAAVEAGQGGAGADVLLAHPLLNGSRERPSLLMRHLVSAAGIGVMLLLLALQYVYFNRAGLVEHAGWRPALEQFCELLHCELPMRTDLARVQMIQRDVRQHPSVKDALLINATFENRAGFVQPFPILEVSFTDSLGVPIAMRRFRPAEYLAAGTDPEAGMAVNVPLQVVLEVQDPGEAAASYQFGFL